MKRIFLLTILIILLLPVWAGAADYVVSTATTTVDGDTFCGGSACTSADTIIIDGGARGDLVFQDFDGSGLYITIQNEDTDRVVITGDGSGGAGIVTIIDCKYIDFRGDNNSTHSWTSNTINANAYGIKIINDGDPLRAGSLWIKGESDHIKVRYIECAFDGNTSETSGIGIFLQDKDLSSSWVWDTIEIDHNYIHGSRYSSLYIGENEPSNYDNPWLANASIHHNLCVDNGWYGMVLKNPHSTSGSLYIYNNIIRGSSNGASTGLVYDADATHKEGISFRSYNSVKFYIYNNWIEETKGEGIKAEGDGYIYNNVFLGCGSDDDLTHGNGIRLYRSTTSDLEIYQNTFVESKRYAIYALSAIAGATVRDNIIVESGVGEWYAEEVGDITEASGAGANTYDTDADNMNFVTWSDDGNYSNDDFNLTATSPALDAGAASGYPPDDYVGTVRPQDSAADDGAYEYIGEAPPPPPPGDFGSYTLWAKCDAADFSAGVTAGTEEGQTDQVFATTDDAGFAADAAKQSTKGIDSNTATTAGYVELDITGEDYADDECSGSFWFRTPSLPTSTATTFFMLYQNATNYVALSLRSNGGFKLATKAGGLSEITAYSATGLITANIWYFIEWRYDDNTNDDILIDLNNVNVMSETGTAMTDLTFVQARWGQGTGENIDFDIDSVRNSTDYNEDFYTYKDQIDFPSADTTRATITKVGRWIEATKTCDTTTPITYDEADDIIPICLVCSEYLSIEVPGVTSVPTATVLPGPLTASEGTAVYAGYDNTGATTVIKLNYTVGVFERSIDLKIKDVASFSIGLGTTKAITTVTKANPGVVTTAGAHELTTGNYVYFNQMGEMTEIEDNCYEITYIDPTSFSIIDTSGFVAAEADGGSEECFKADSYMVDPYGNMLDVDLTAAGLDLGVITIAVLGTAATPVEFSSTSTLATAQAAGWYAIGDDYLGVTDAGGIGAADMSASDGTADHPITLDGGGFEDNNSKTYGDYWIITRSIS